MLLKGVRFGMLLQLAVGPICLFIFQTAASSGFITSATGAMAVTVIDGLFILAAIVGIGTIFQKYKKSIQFFGASILMLFGLSNITNAFGFSLIPSFHFAATESVESIFFKTLLLTLSNPLTILFWAGVFSTKITEEKMKPKEMYVFGIGAVLSTLFFLTFVAMLGTLLNSFLSTTIINGLNVLVGVALIYFGLKIVLKKKDTRNEKA